jgi:molecular chaperone GrpE
VNPAGERDQKSDKDPEVRVVDRRWWARGDAPASDESGARKPTYIEELEQRLADATAQLQRVMTEHRSSLDEFEQVKIRLRRDVSREVERGKRGLLADLLDVLDNLDRALSATATISLPPAASSEGRAPQAAEFERFVRGVELVRDQFLSKLGAVGVARVPAVGLLFDAQKHEAVSLAPVADASEDGLIIAVVKEGYAIGDEVLRPAAVIVGRHAPSSAPIAYDSSHEP